MKYMLRCYDDEKAWERAGETASKEAIAEAVQLTHELAGKGQYQLAAPLHPSATAKSVRRQNGKAVVTDGPFIETREVLGGFYLIDVETLEQAIEIATRHPGNRYGGVEVRQVLEIDGLPRL